MSFRIFVLLSALHCVGVLATVFSPGRFAATSFVSPRSNGTIRAAGVRIYGATANRVGIRELVGNGDPNLDPTLYKTWRSAAILTSVVTAHNSDFAVVCDDTPNIAVFYERDHGNGTTSLASAQYNFADKSWATGDFSVASGLFKPGTRLAASMWESGRISVAFQDVNGLVYEKINNGNGWGAPSLFAVADQNTDLAAFGYVNSTSGIGNTFVYLRLLSQTYEYTWQSDVGAWQARPVPGFTSGGSFGITSFNEFSSSRIYYISNGVGEFTGNPGNWQKLSNLANPRNVGPASDVTTTTLFIGGKWWTNVFYSATDGTLWQETYVWSGQNAGWAVPNQVVV